MPNWLFLFALLLCIEVLEQDFTVLKVCLTEIWFWVSNQNSNQNFQSKIHWSWKCVDWQLQWSVNSVKEDIVVIIIIIIRIQSPFFFLHSLEESVIQILNLSIFILLCLCKRSLALKQRIICAGLLRCLWVWPVEGSIVLWCFHSCTWGGTFRWSEQVISKFSMPFELQSVNY